MSLWDFVDDLKNIILLYWIYIELLLCFNLIVLMLLFLDNNCKCVCVVFK